MVEYYFIITIIFVLLFGFVKLIYLYYDNKFNYWKNLNIPGPKPNIIFGNLLKLLFNPKTDIEIQWYQKFGKIYGIFYRNEPVLTVAEPEIVKQVLVEKFNTFRNRRPSHKEHAVISKTLIASRDGDWKRIRAITSPTFSSSKMKRMYPIINKCCAEFVDALYVYASEGKDVDLKCLYGAYTMDVIARCAFATNTNSHKDPNNIFIKNALKIFNVAVWKLFLLAILPKFISKKDFVRRFLGSIDANEFFVEFSRHIIQQRRERNEKHEDFLQLLMDAQNCENESRDENHFNESHHMNDGIEANKTKYNGFEFKDKMLSENEILAQCYVFIAAGYETTGTTLSFCTYELALNPEIQETLYQEIIEAFDGNEEINYELLTKLPFLDAVISETLRIHSPIIRITRETMNDTSLRGIEIKKGILIEIPIHAIHMDSDNYENPELFNPYRFMPYNRDNIKPYTYLPFGGGPRGCIGMRFGLLEAKLAMVSVIRRFRFVRTDRTEVPLKINRGTIVLQAKSIVVGIEPR